MMIDDVEFRRLLNFLQEPVFIVRRSGKIETANAGARAALGGDPVGRHLGDYATTAPEKLEAYLWDCAGSGNPIVSAIVLRHESGREQRFQIKGALLSKQEGQRHERIVLRCSDTAFREFSQMSRQVNELNRENRRQRHDRAVLQEAVAHRDLLLRELQHRVRNHTQMILGMISTAQRTAVGEELSTFLDGLKGRLLAIGSVQQLMYVSARLDSLSAASLLDGLCRPIADSWPPGAELTVDSIDVELSNETAIPLALIINELLSNALKHGLKYGSGRAVVKLTDDQHDLVLTVWDSGPGFTSDEVRNRSSSGMALVRGLCRQIGGSLSISSDGGTCCTVRFPRMVSRAETEVE